MPSPCGIIFNGKEYSYEDFAAYLHEGGLDKFVADKVVDDSAFKGKVKPIEQPTADDRIGKEVSFEHAGSERTGKVQGVDEKGNLKIKDSRGINYTVAPNAARSVDLVEQAKKSIDSSLKQLENLSKGKQEQPEKMPPMQKSVIGMDIPFKALGVADKQIAALTGKIEDGISKSFRRGMEHSNKFVRTAANLGQGLFRNAALTGEEIVRRRMGLGAIKAAPLKALKFYENAVDIVGKTPESLRNVHMVLDPEVYSKRGETPITENNLSPAEKNLYNVLRQMNNMIHDWHYANGRISEETYLKNKDKYAPRFYDNIEFDGYPDEIKQAFEDYSKKQNFSYVKERQAFEDVMNENKIYEDPVYGTSMRLAQMLRNQAVMQYAADIATTTKTYSDGDANIPENYVKLDGGGKFGSIKTYGELTNKYVPRDVAEDFKGYIFLNEFTNKVYDVGKSYDKLWVRQALKKSKTQYNPITQLGNILTNYVFAMMNGIDPVSYQTRKFEAAKIVKDKSPLYVQLVEEGILGSDIITKDIKEASKGKPEKTGVRKALSDIDESISDFYGSRDEIAKVAAYLAHTKDYGLSHKEAVDKVYSGFQNYNNVGRYYDLGSKLPVVGNPFIKFKGDLVRIMKNNYAQRPLTNIAILAALNAVANAFSNWSDENEVVREIRERRKFIPKIPLPEAVGGDIPLVWKTPYGEINAARYFAPASIYDMGDKNSLAEDVSSYLPLQVEPNESGVPLPKIQDPFLGTYAQVAFDKDFRGQPILDPEKTKFREGNATTEEKIQNAATFIARQQIPFFANANDMIRASNGESDYYGRNRTLQQSILNTFVKVQEFEKPEAQESIEKEIKFQLGKMDRLNKKIGDAKSVAAKEIKKIKDKGLPKEKESELVQAQVLRAQNKIAELMDEQAQIKADLLKPKEYLEKLKTVK